MRYFRAGCSVSLSFDCEDSEGRALTFFFLAFLSFFSFGAEIDGEGVGESLASSWGEVERAAGLAVITLSAWLAVDASKEGSSATQAACQVWKSCWELSPSWILVSGVKATDLRLLTGLGSTVEGAILGRAAMAALPLTFAKASPVVDLAFLDFFVRLSVVAISTAKPISVIAFLFLPFVTVILLALFSPSSSLAYFSLRPIFFHAGICCGVDSDMGAIAETTTTVSK